MTRGVISAPGLVAYPSFNGWRQPPHSAACGGISTGEGLAPRDFLSLTSVAGVVGSAFQLAMSV